MLSPFHYAHYACQTVKNTLDGGPCEYLFAEVCCDFLPFPVRSLIV